MDNVALPNVLPSPSAGVVSAGSQPIDDSGDPSAIVFAGLLAKQIAQATPQQSLKNQVAALFSDTSSQPENGKAGAQPVDIITQDFYPELLAQRSAALLVSGQGDADVSKVDVLKKTGISDKPDVITDTLHEGQDSAIAIPNLVPVGNLQPMPTAPASPSGKDLPVSVAAAPATAWSVAAPTVATSPAVAASPTLATSQQSAASAEIRNEEPADAAGSFAKKLESVIAADGAKQDHTMQLPSHSVVSPVVERVANAAPASAGIPQQVGAPHWDTGLGDKVVWMIGSQTQNAQLHLNPPNLGPLEISLSMADGQANLSFVTQHVAVRDAIEAASPRLREMMGDSGISMGSVSVNVGSFTQQQPDQQQGRGEGFLRNQNDQLVAGTDESPSVVVQSLDNQGLVNLFA